jgi:hypothetical protein
VSKGGGSQFWNGALAAGEKEGHWRKWFVAFTVARLPAMNQLPKAAHSDVVKLQGTWPSRGRRPTPTRLSRPAVRQVGTVAGAKQCPKLIPSARFFTHGSLSAFNWAWIATPTRIRARDHRRRGGWTCDLIQFTVLSDFHQSVWQTDLQGPDLRFLCSNYLIHLYQSCRYINQLQSCYSNHTQILTGSYSK